MGFLTCNQIADWPTVSPDFRVKKLERQMKSACRFTDFSSRKLLRIRVWGKESSRCTSHSISFKTWCWDGLIKPSGLLALPSSLNSIIEGSKIAQGMVLVERFSLSVEAPAGSFISHISQVFFLICFFSRWIQVMAWCVVHELFFFSFWTC